MTSNITVKKANDYEKIAMCYHEASHTICGLLNLIKVELVHVPSEKDKNGLTQFELYDASKVESKSLVKILSIREVKTFYAGMMGEKIYYKEICGSDKFPMHLRIGSAGDIGSAANLIRKHTLSEPGEDSFLFKKQLQFQVKELLSQYWMDVRLISHALYRQTELSFDELKYILTRRSDNKVVWKSKFKEISTIYNDNYELDEQYLKNLLIKI